MDIIQLVVIIISFILTGLFIFLGVQVWYILKEMKLSLQKVNKMLDDATKVTGTVSEGFAGMAGLMGGIKAGLSLFSSFRKKGGHDE
ncbi:hypothetical protein A2973_02095 [Candidatus Gottesmanbacteria bacterium RIFCSPLOWO2_01_FULL_49_10]|uniref:Uncharacterized protein n=1 Tax=Candidatus Gottesmanbacteria bacterium RIFCSPLOWO2_01_FULL_49_10 TaxID=1798396 RepID=A0A1F6AZ72_9BACT|nr:MAG: hypothetical protein UY10_C0007G0016 [Microgenomates group bacterium GW2011_GWA2_47_8]OGG29843.1 MAG: hypothetical protein A2973_02095 [Candidatus Gottesmanbacteria bacterium RIFCSPLOWO2_01_FULL_49_10]